MTKHVKYIWALLLVLACCGCSMPLGDLRKWEVTLDREDKRPYGSYLAFQSMKLYFPDAHIEDLSKGFRYSSLNSGAADNTAPALLVAVGLDFFVSEEEMESLVAFVKNGNEIVIFARSLDDKLEQMLRLRVNDNGMEEVRLNSLNNGAENKAVLSIPESSNRRFGYQGRSIKAWFNFDKPDTASDHDGASNQDDAASPDTTLSFSAVDSIGYVNKHPDFVRYTIGRGHITLHAAPLVMSNYFLLQKGNEDYLSAIWQTLPARVDKVFWSSYYKRSSEPSDFNVLFRYPAVRWAFFLAMAGLLVYVIFESRRRQRIIPVIKPLENTSISFVETVGRLYYNQGDHQNLADKMVQHFLEWVRTHYYINTGSLDQNFADQLVIRSGLPENVVISLVELMNNVQLRSQTIDDADLYHLHTTMQRFYKNHLT